MNPVVNPLINVLTVLPLTIMQFFYATLVFDMKKKNWYVMSASGICAVFMYLNCIGVVSTGIRVAAAVILTLFYAVLFVKERYMQTIVWGGLTLLVMYLCEGISAVIIYLVAGESYFKLMENPILLTIMRISFLGVNFILMSMLCHFWKKTVDKKTLDLMKFLPLFTMQMVFFYISLSSFWDREMTIWVAFIMFGIALLNVFLDGMLYFFLKEAEKNVLETHKNEQLQVLLVHQKERKEELDNERLRAEEIRTKILRGLTDAKELLLQKDSKNAVRHLNKVTDDLSIKCVHSENRVVDAVLSDKAKECLEKKIELDTSLDIPKRMPVKNAQVCVIFANLLDNAIRACERWREGGGAGKNVKDKQKKPYIHLAARERGGYLVIRQENSFDGVVEDRKKGHLSEHGLGLGIVKQIAENYDGRVQTETEDGKFVTIVTIKM